MNCNNLLATNQSQAKAKLSQISQACGERSRTIAQILFCRQFSKGRPPRLDDFSPNSPDFAQTFRQHPPRLRAHLTWLLICCLLSLAACQSQSDAWARIQRSGVLRVGIDPTYPPFAVATDNDLWGFDVDLMRAIAAAYDLEPQFIYFGYDGLYDALSTEQVDVLASALVVQPERTRDFAYSQPYFDAGQVLIVPAASPIAAPDDLAEHVLAVELGAQGHVLATTWQRRLPNLTIVPYRSVGEALDAAANGNADAALTDSISGRLYLQQTPHLVRLSPPVESEPYALVVRADDALLLTRLNAALQDLQRSGALDEITRRWLDSPAN